MTGDLLLASIVESLGQAIEDEPNFDRRRNLKDARSLVRHVLWWTEAAATKPAPEVTIPDPALNRERHP